MISLAHVFDGLGALFAGAALLNLRDRRWAMAGFWAIIAAALLGGDAILAADKAGTAWPAQLMGGGVIALAGLAALAGRGRQAAAVIDGAAREASARRLGSRLFVPALALPALMIAILEAAPHLPWPLIDPATPSLVALGVAAALATALALAMTRARPTRAVTEARRLLDTIGWAVVLPTLLATLGSVFAATGVGDAVAGVVRAVIPTDSLMACLLAYALGMVAFTVIMGNAFAAFPVLTAGIGLPLLVHGHGADPAALGALGMLTGYCGTLLTPMAANFNLVPVLLLDLRSDYAVIRAQWPTALALVITNLIVMRLVVF
ncbi:MAG TPA: DUF979 family protein [Kofleriaceae bacterium]